jgi:hypothetical protein
MRYFHRYLACAGILGARQPMVQQWFMKQFHRGLEMLRDTVFAVGVTSEPTRSCSRFKPSGPPGD